MGEGEAPDGSTDNDQEQDPLGFDPTSDPATQGLGAPPGAPAGVAFDPTAAFNPVVDVAPLGINDHHNRLNALGIDPANPVTSREQSFMEALASAVVPGVEFGHFSFPTRDVRQGPTSPLGFSPLGFLGAISPLGPLGSALAEKTGEVVGELTGTNIGRASTTAESIAEALTAPSNETEAAQASSIGPPSTSPVGSPPSSPVADSTGAGINAALNAPAVQAQTGQEQEQAQELAAALVGRPGFTRAGQGVVFT